MYRKPRAALDNGETGWPGLGRAWGGVAVERSAGPDAGVHGRAADLARLGRFLDEVTGHPAALLIEGEPGLGKTTLWSAGIDQARRRGWRVLTCRPVQAEAALSLSALGDLLEPVPDAVLSELPGPQRRALDVALLRAEPGPEPPDQRAVAVAFLGVIRALAQAAPVLIGVDDLPWLDRASAAVLEYAQRRLTTQPAGLLATAATGDSASPAGHMRGRFPPGRLHALTVGPLALEAMDAVLRAKGGPPEAWPEVVEVHEASGGNPYFAQELAAALGAHGRRRGSRQPLPVPGSLRPLVQRRLAALSPAGREVALVAAAAPAPTVGVVLAASGVIVASSPARCAVSRRSAYSRTAAEDRSSQGRSSTPTITGAVSARARITPSKATATARWSGGSGPGSARNSATSSARRCGRGSPASTCSGTDSSRSPRAEKLSAASDWTGRQVSTQQPRRRARSIPANHRVVLPMPAAPSISNATGPLITSSRKPSIRANSAARPCTPAA